MYFQIIDTHELAETRLHDTNIFSPSYRFNTRFKYSDRWPVLNLEKAVKRNLRVRDSYITSPL